MRPSILSEAYSVYREKGFASLLEKSLDQLTDHRYRQLKSEIVFRRRRNSIPDLDLQTRDIIILTVDCLRADHLSRAGYHRKTTPFLDDIGSFDTAISAAPWTYSSVPSILTGLYPHNHGAAFDRDFRDEFIERPPHRIRSDVYTLQELLRANGYRTYFDTGVSTAELSLRGHLPPKWQVSNDASADALIADFFTWWDSSPKSSRFAYLQFADLHSPLRKPETQPFREIPDLDGIQKWRYHTEGDFGDSGSEAFKEEKIRLYDTILRGVDRQIQNLYRRLQERRDAEETLIVVTGDHGEDFWENLDLKLDVLEIERNRALPVFGHGHTLAPENVDVPLLFINGPEIDATAQKSTVDIVPTVLDQLSVDNSFLTRFDGFPVDRIPTDRVVIAEEVSHGYDRKAAVRGPNHVIHSPHKDVSVLIDRDSGTVREDADDQISELLPHLERDTKLGKRSDIDDRTEQHLRDLGYR